jgi:methyl-accepting chemotaxis protein
MKWFLNRSTRTKLLLGFGAMIVMLGVVGGTAYRGITALLASHQLLYEDNVAEVIDVMATDTNLLRSRLAVFTMLSTTKRSDQETPYRFIQGQTKANDEILRRLRARNEHGPTPLTRLDEYIRLLEEFQHTRDTEIIPLVLDGQIAAAQALVLGVQNERYLKLEAFANEMVQQSEAEATAALQRSEQAAQRSISVFLVVGLMAVLLTVAMALFFSRVLANPLREMAGVAEQVAAGNLSARTPVSGRTDEVGVLAQSFGKMMESLRTMNREIRDGVNVLASAASEILAATTQIASGAAETATAVEETTTTVEEVRQTTDVASQKSAYVADISQQTAQASQEGKQSVEAAIAGMQHIKNQMESIADSVVRLSEQGQAIGEIIASVNDLAEQSNLLAVNAAIEAAKAGDQGRGFAVVAQEIRGLAEQSKQATAQVRTILGDIEKATSAAVMATEQGSKAVEAGTQRSAQAGDSIRTLATTISETAQAAMQISASSRQQATGMDQIAVAMENIKQASAQNVAGTKQSETSAQNLHELGQKLKHLVEQYQV